MKRNSRVAAAVGTLACLCSCQPHEPSSHQYSVSQTYELGCPSPRLSLPVVGNHEQLIKGDALGTGASLDQESHCKDNMQYIDDSAKAATEAAALSKCDQHAASIAYSCNDDYLPCSLQETYPLCVITSSAMTFKVLSRRPPRFRRNGTLARTGSIICRYYWSATAEGQRTGQCVIGAAP